MAMVARLHICPQSLDHFNFQDYHHHRTGPTVLFGSGRRRSGSGRNGFYSKQYCRSFRGEEGGGDLKEGEGKLKKGSGVWKSLSSTLLGGVGLRSRQSDEYKKAVAKVEEVCSSAAIQIGRYIVTMMSTGVILTIGFQLSGGDSQLNALVWYSWLGGIIIGTMIGSIINIFPFFDAAVVLG